MRKLLSSKEQRHLHLIETLYHEEEWITFAELAAKLGCSVRILKDDLFTLKKEYTELTVHSSTQGIKLSFKKNIGLKSIYQKFLHSSELVELFQIIFNEEHHSAEELAELLFISLSTLRRLINKAKPYLERYYKISIQTSPYKMVGDEKDIRYFYYQLYQEAYPTMEWPFDLLDEATYDTFLQSFLESGQVALSYPDYRSLKMTTAINTVRLQHHHPIEDLDCIDAKKVYHYRDNQNLLYFSKNLFGFPLTTETLNQIFYPYTTSVLLSNRQELQLVEASTPSLKAANHYLIQWLEQVATEYQAPLPDTEQILVDLYNVSMYCLSLKPKKALLYDHRRLFVEHIKHSYPHAYKLLAEGLRVYWHKLNGHSNETVLDFLIHVVFTHWPNLIPDIRQRAHKNVSVLVFSLNDGHHARMIREMIHYQMDSQLTIDLFSGNYLSIEKL